MTGSREAGNKPEKKGSLGTCLQGLVQRRVRGSGGKIRGKNLRRGTEGGFNGSNNCLARGNKRWRESGGYPSRGPGWKKKEGGLEERTSCAGGVVCLGLLRESTSKIRGKGTGHTGEERLGDHYVGVKSDSILVREGT